ncbi:hypothetical protein V6N11_032477 [Hibiscus sabdariffa]|uniref:Uncharacterized protein n=1 Tax=Hibiscus sabdariffa TaxID=183260 RepID=A0ABR2T1G8_9ROSI
MIPIALAPPTIDFMYNVPLKPSKSGWQEQIHLRSPFSEKNWSIWEKLLDWLRNRNPPVPLPNSQQNSACRNVIPIAQALPPIDFCTISALRGRAFFPAGANAAISSADGLPPTSQDVSKRTQGYNLGPPFFDTEKVDRFEKSFSTGKESKRSCIADNQVNANKKPRSAPMFL